MPGTRWSRQVTGKAGQFLSWVAGIFRRRVPTHCERWGCLLPVHEGSAFGRGPVCMVCRYGLRHVAMPRRGEQ